MGVAALLVLLIGASFAMSGRARTTAESEAELRAEQSVVAGLSSGLTPELVQRDIRDREYQDLLVDIQSGIMSDANVVRVRIWKPDGDLVFSTAQLDDVAEFTAVGNAQIQQASEGTTVSVVAEVTDAPLAGLEGSEEALFVTYVPLQFGEDAAPAGVVEIDQTYSAILQDVNGLWRPVQIGLGVALLGLGALFGVSQRRSKRRQPSKWSAKPARQSDDARRIRDAEDRVLAAERTSKLAEERLEQAEARVAELEKSEVPPEVKSRLEELEMKLRAEEAEREQAAGEAKRLRSALSEREAELALVRDKSTSSEAEKARSVDAILRAEQQHADAEQRAAAAGTLAAEAEGRAVQARNKVAELEAALRDADRRISEAVAEATKAATQTSLEREAEVSAELRAAQLEASSMKLRLAETEEILRQTEARRADGEAAAAELGKVRADADAGRAEIDELRAGLQRALLDLEAARNELDGSRTQLQAASSDAGAAKTELEISRGERDRALAEIERLRGERQGASAEVEGSRAEVQAARAGVQASRDEAQAARAELEVSRGERDRALEEVERARAELEAMGAEMRRQTAERVAADRGPADDLAATAGQGASDAIAALGEMESRIAELETRRRSDVAELQRAQESLANTQVELMESNRKLRASEDRLRELERNGGIASHGAPSLESVERAAPEPAGDEPVWSYDTADAGLESTFASLAPDEPKDSGGSTEPEEPAEEALSLRERLARAAAARHRTVQPHD